MQYISPLVQFNISENVTIFPIQQKSHFRLSGNGDLTCAPHVALIFDQNRRNLRFVSSRHWIAPSSPEVNQCYPRKLPKSLERSCLLAKRSYEAQHMT